MGRRSDHSREQIRDMAIEAAEQILAEQGINGLSTRKVAKSIGYTVGTLYLAFKNLDDIILHINAKTLDELYDYLKQATTRCSVEQDSIKRLGQSYFEFARNNHARWSLLFEYQSQEEVEIPGWFRQRVQRLISLVEQTLTAIAPLKPAVKIQLAAQILWSGVHGICVLNMKDKLSVVSNTTVETLINEYVALFVAGYLANEK